MLSDRTQSILADYLKSVAEAENSVEITRLVLAEKKEFKPYSAFTCLDADNKGYLSPRDLLEFMEELGLAPYESQIRSYFDLYDSNDDSRLSYSDFKNAVLPATDSYLREAALTRPTYRSDSPLSYAASWALARVLEKEIESSKTLDYKNRCMTDRYDWDVHTAFRNIDRERFGYIDPEAIRNFFDDVGSVITNKEMDALFRRADKDCDGRIDFSEFSKLVQPIRRSDKLISAGSPIRTKRSTSPRRQEALSPRYGSPSRIKLDSPMISDVDYYRYLQESARRNSPRRTMNSYRASSPRMSPRNQSPSLRKELTDYRVDSGYRTVRSPRRDVESPTSGRGSPRSRSPRYRSEVTDYRVSSNYRTVKAYDETASPQRSYDNQYESLRTPTRTRDSNYASTYSYGSRTKSPPRYMQEPTTYREETGYRTVRHYDMPPQTESKSEARNEEKNEQKNEDQVETKNEPQTETKKEAEVKSEPQTEKKEEKSEPEEVQMSGIKEEEEKPEKKEVDEAISKKLEFEAPQEVKKDEPQDDNKEELHEAQNIEETA
mmetsp:Transcript_6070/g.6670  ORF Transcript_6070/g.6670 Transcript_6070/m.6670 type:complete len:547 (+) Transcript_6070:46-1686(+)